MLSRELLRLPTEELAADCDESVVEARDRPIGAIITMQNNVYIKDIWIYKIYIFVSIVN